jgi:hypothetical protein
MDNFKKSEENVVNFIVDSLKGTNSDSVGKLTSMPEMRNLTPSIKPENPILQPDKKILKNIMKFLGFLLILFVIYKILQTYPDIMAKIKSIFGTVEKEIKSIKFVNPMFDASNNLNSNQILDFLLGTKSQPKEEWCFIGESKGTRYCALSEGNQCMSGNIFPSKNMCVNPKLKI